MYKYLSTWHEPDSENWKTQQAAKKCTSIHGKMLNQDFFSAASANSWLNETENDMGRKGIFAANGSC